MSSLDSSSASTPAPLALPSQHESQLAWQGQRTLAVCLTHGLETLQLQIIDHHNQAQTFTLPTSALRLLVDILAAMAEGHAVQVVPVHAELTTKEAADLLKVSRPHLVQLLERGALPFHQTGQHRRVRFVDLMQYETAREAVSDQAMAELAEQAQDLDLGYGDGTNAR